MMTKIVLLGPAGVGKSAILRSMNKESFISNSESTIGCNFIRIKKDDITLDIWDTAGQERFMTITPIYYRNADIVICVFDVTNITSIEKMSEFMRLYYNTVSDNHAKIVVVGNKIDKDKLDEQFLLRALSNYKYFKDLKVIFTSAKTGLGIDTLMDQLITFAIDIKPRVSENILSTYTIKPRSCCA